MSLVRLAAHLEAVCDISYTRPVAIRMRHHHHMMPLLHQALRQLVNVIFYAAKIGEEKVADHEDAEVGGPLRFICLWVAIASARS